MIEKLHERYKEELKIIKDNMNKALKASPANEEMIHLLEEVTNNPGKMLRPILMLLVSGNYDELKKDELLSTAAGMELIHNSSLVLDDMLDKASIRRGIPTVVSRFGSPVALCVGDYMLAASYKYIMNKGYNSSAIEMIDAVEKACDGEMIQNLNRKNTKLDEETYFKAIEGKTAALFEIVCESACRITSKDEEYKNQMAKLGIIIGTMFQLRDDLLDWTSTEEEIGKPVNEDFSEGIYTLPAIYTFRSEEYGNKLKEIASKSNLSIEDYSQVRSIVTSSGGIDYTREYIKRLANEGRELINIIDNPESKHILEAIISGLEK